MRLTIPAALDMVASHHEGVTKLLLKSRARTKTIAHARQEAMVIFRDVYKMSFHQIGAIFDRDHTTIMDGVKAATARAEKCSGTAHRLHEMRDAAGTPKFVSTRNMGVFKSMRARA